MSTAKQQATENTEQEVPKEGIGGLIAHLRQSRTTALIILGSIFGLSVSGGIILYFIYESSQPKLTAERILEALDNQELEEARLLALKLNELSDQDHKLAGVPAYVIGAVEAKYAEDEWNPQKQKIIYASVAANMKHARMFGIPEDRKPNAAYLLAKSLFRSGKYNESIPAMKATALDQPPSKRAELIGYMIDVYMRDPTLSKEQALTDLRNFLANTDLDVEQRDETLLHEANLLIRLNQFPEAQRVMSMLSTRPGIADRAQLVTGQMEFAQAVYQAKQSQSNTLNATLLSNAIARFDKVINTNPDSQLADEARLNLADANFHIGDFEQAHIGYSYLSRQFEGSPLGIHAALKEATSLLRLDQINEGIQVFRTAMSDAAKPQNQKLSRWLDPHWVQRSVKDACDYLVDKAYFAEAVILASDLLKMVAKYQPPISTHIPRMLKAETYRRWAEHLENESQGGGNKANEQIHEDALARHRDAGRAYYQFSLARKENRDYPEQLFRCAEHYFLGHDMIRAIKAYQMYLDSGDAQFAAQAYIRLAEAKLAMQEFDQGYEYAEQTWKSYPSDPVVYRARIVAATIRQEQGRLEEAKENLLANIESQELTPRSQEWIDSKLLFGQLQFDEASEHEAKARELDWYNLSPKIATKAQFELSESYHKFLDAIDSLTEYSIRTESQGPSLHVHYLLGQAYRRAAQWPRLQAELTTINSKNAEWKRNRNDLLLNAYNEFQLVCDHFSSFEDRGELDEFQKQLLLNSYFGRALAQFHMGQYDQALKSYRALATRYIKQPDALEAFVQMANCYRRLNQHDEARNVISQAKLALTDRIPRDAKFIETTRYSRDEWTSLLDLLEQLQP